MRYQDVGTQCARQDVLQQLEHVPLNMRLSAFEGKAFLKGIADQESMNKARAQTWKADCAAAPGGCYGLAYDFTAASLRLDHGQRGFYDTAFGLKADAVHTATDAAHPGLVNDVLGGIVHLFKIDGLHPVGLHCVLQPVRMVVHHEYLVRPQQPRAGCCHLANRPPPKMAKVLPGTMPASTTAW